MTEIRNAEDLYRLIIGNNIRLVCNMVFPWSPGHMVAELDNFLRMRRLGELDADANYMIVLAEHEITQTIAQIYGPLFGPQHKSMLVINGALFSFAREIAKLCPELCVDVSISHSRYSYDRSGPYRLGSFMGSLQYVVSNADVIRREDAWRKRQSRSEDYQPLSAGPAIEPDLAAYLGDHDKLALVHRRQESVNNGGATEPAQYYASLEWLRDNGYRTVFVSREAFPAEFAQFGVLDYAHSPVASFRNDLALFKAANVAIISGAGIGCLAQVMEAPMVWTNYWILSAAFANANTIWLPMMVRDKETGRRLKFIEQIRLFHTLADPWDTEPDAYSGSGTFGNPWSFSNKAHLYDLCPPSAEDMYEAMRECLRLKAQPRPRSPMQEMFRMLDPTCGLLHSRGRISQSFLEGNRDALLPGF